MDATTRRALIERYKDGYRVVSEALEHVTDAELDAHSAAGGWTAREIAHHLADSEMTSAIRLRRLLAARRPAIMGYDEAEFAPPLYYDRPLGASLALLEAVRRPAAHPPQRLAQPDSP